MSTTVTSTVVSVVAVAKKRACSTCGCVGHFKKACTAEPILKIKTKNATTAANGNKAEALLCTQPNVKVALETYFKKPIASISQIPGRKKADNRISFADGTEVLVQNKNGKVEGRGHSVDRRKATLLTDHAELHTLLTGVCNKKEGDKKVTVTGSVRLGKAISEECVNLCLLGTDAATRPAYFLHTNLDLSGSVITHLAIVGTADFMGAVVANLFPEMDVKRTCVHMSPHLYFQRKGGGKADHAPDDIQLKMRFSPGASKAIPHPVDLFALFATLPLA